MLRQLAAVWLVGASVLSLSGPIASAKVKLSAMGTDPIEKWQPLVDAFMAENPDIAVEYMKIDGGKTLEKMVVLSAGGTPPDVVTWMLGSTFVPLASQGLLADITPYVNKDFLNAYYPGPLNLSSYKGRLYGLPIFTGTMGTYYNKDLFEKAGIGSIPTDYNWADFLNYAKKTTRDENRDGVPEYWGFTQYQYIRDYMNWVWTNGGSFVNEQGTRFTMNSPDATEALQFLADVALVHRVSPTPNVYSQTAAWTLWYDGYAAMYPCGSWCLGSSRTRNHFNWDVTTFPTRKAFTVVNEPFIGGVAAGSKHIPEATQFLRWLSHSDKAQALVSQLGHGIPAVRSVANKAFADPTTPQHEEVFLLMLNSGLPKIMPYTPNWTDIDRAINRKMGEVFSGKTSAGQAMNELEPEINGLLQAAVGVKR